jgi:hypothetical protein
MIDYFADQWREREEGWTDEGDRHASPTVRFVEHIRREEQETKGRHTTVI